MTEQKANVLFEETIFYRDNLRPKINLIIAVLAAVAFLYFSTNINLRSVSFFLCAAALWELFLIIFFRTKIEVSTSEIKVFSAPFNNVKTVFWKEVKSAGSIRIRNFEGQYPRFGFGDNPFFNAGCTSGIVFNLRDGHTLRLGIKNTAELDKALRKVFSRKV